MYKRQDSWLRFLVMMSRACENSRSLAQVGTNVAGFATKRRTMGYVDRCFCQLFSGQAFRLIGGVASIHVQLVVNRCCRPCAAGNSRHDIFWFCTGLNTASSHRSVNVFVPVQVHAKLLTEKHATTCSRRCRCQVSLVRRP